MLTFQVPDVWSKSAQHDSSQSPYPEKDQNTFEKHIEAAKKIHDEHGGQMYKQTEPHKQYFYDLISDIYYVHNEQSNEIIHNRVKVQPYKKSVYDNFYDSIMNIMNHAYETYSTYVESKFKGYRMNKPNELIPVLSAFNGFIIYIIINIFIISTFSIIIIHIHIIFFTIVCYMSIIYYFIVSCLLLFKIFLSRI